MKVYQYAGIWLLLLTGFLLFTEASPALSALCSLALCVVFYALYQCLKALLEGVQKAVDGGKDYLEKNTKLLVRLFFIWPAAALLCGLYWFHPEWVFLWMVLLLPMFHISLSWLLDKRKKKPEEMTVVVGNPGAGFELKSVPKLKDSGDLWAASFDAEGKALGLSRVEEKRGKGYAAPADGAKHVRLFYWDGNVDLKEKPWAKHPEAGLPENAKAVKCDVEF